jgi:ATP/maltotriose-dependent transcriptional regulator MalT
LCRAFLDSKLWELQVPPTRFHALVDALIANEQWNDAFDLISRTDLTERFPELLAECLRKLLSTGEVATLERWIDWASKKQLEAPELTLARAEVYLRRGSWQLSEKLAIRSGEDAATSKVAAQAYLCAGAAAHLQDISTRAREHYARALELDASPDNRLRALWGDFLIMVHEPESDISAGLAALESASDSSPEQLLRVHEARVTAADRQGRIADAASDALALLPLLDEIEDPFLRTSFLNVVADALVASANYELAAELADVELRESERFRLRFVLPNALVNLAGARLGAGGLTAASTLVERAERVDDTSDDFGRVKRAIVMARIRLARGDAHGAISLLSSRSVTAGRRDLTHEALGTRAIAEASIGDFAAARQTAAEIPPSPRYAAARTLLAAANAIESMDEAGLSNLARTTSETQAYDVVICSVRAAPALMQLGAAHSEMREIFRVIAERSGDAALARIAGDVSMRRRPPMPLSARERDVLQLASQGFRNADIASRLFISPTTVKTHLQNIYEKLGVRSRTEAALKAREAGWLS